MNYREIDVVNQSLLKKMFGSINKIKSTKVNHGMVIGDGVDTLMFNPELFDSKFLLFSGKIPTANPAAIISRGLEDGDEFDDLVLVTHELGLYPKMHDDTIRKKLEPFREYYLATTSGKRIISVDDLNTIQRTKYNLENSFTKDVVEFLNYHGNTQKILLGNLDLEVKGLADWYYENRGDDVTFGNIIVPKDRLLIADLKVGAYNPENVERFMDKWDTYFQLTFYSLIAEQMTGLKACNPVVVYANSMCNYTSYYQMTDLQVEEAKERIKDAIRIYKLYNGDYDVHYRVREQNGLINPI